MRILIDLIGFVSFMVGRKIKEKFNKGVKAGSNAASELP